AGPPRGRARAVGGDRGAVARRWPRRGAGAGAGGAMRWMVWLTLWLSACGGPAVVEEAAEAPDLSARVDWAVVEPATDVIVTTLPAEAVVVPGGRAAVGPEVAGRVVRWRVSV